MHVFGRSHREHANYTDFTPTTFLLQDANHCTTVTPNDFIFKNLFFKKAKKKTPNRTKPYHMQWNFACFIMLVHAVSLVKMQPLCLNDSESFETDWSLLNCMDLPNSLLSEVFLTDGSCDLSSRTTKAKKPRSSNTLWLVGSWIMVMLEPVKP